jgi:hypothetical protein
MIDPIFYLMLAPLAMAIVVALIVLARRGSKKSLGRTIRVVVLILGIGLLIPIVLFVLFTAAYYSGTGH